MTVLTLKMDGLAINNGSQIQCYSAYVTVDISAPASLVIAGERGGRGRGRTLLGGADRRDLEVLLYN